MCKVAAPLPVFEEIALAEEDAGDPEASRRVSYPQLCPPCLAHIHTRGKRIKDVFRIQIEPVNSVVVIIPEVFSSTCDVTHKRMLKLKEGLHVLVLESVKRIEAMTIQNLGEYYRERLAMRWSGINFYGAHQEKLGSSWPFSQTYIFGLAFFPTIR